MFFLAEHEDLSIMFCESSTSLLQHWSHVENVQTEVNLGCMNKTKICYFLLFMLAFWLSLWSDFSCWFCNVLQFFHYMPCYEILLVRMVDCSWDHCSDVCDYSVSFNWWIDFIRY